MTEVTAPRDIVWQPPFWARLRRSGPAYLPGDVHVHTHTYAHARTRTQERVSRGNGCIPRRCELFSHQTAYPGGTQRLLSATKLNSPPGRKEEGEEKNPDGRDG